MSLRTLGFRHGREQRYDGNLMTDSTLHFRSVLRGYDTAQVDRHMRELAQASEAARHEADERNTTVSSLEAAAGQLRSEVERYAKRVRGLEEAQTRAVTPTYAALGDRIGSILTLADKEAVDLRARAGAEASRQQALADEGAAATRRDADHYAQEIRSAAEAKASRCLEDARRQADSLLDDADRQATVRREETEALYELARAKSATEAVDFETTLAARREASALEFAADVSAAEQQLATLRLRSEESRIESEQARQDAAFRSSQELDQATTNARKLVAEARTKAEHIRGDSERELAAATQRRDSINVQLSNVRQMIAALGGAAIIDPLELSEPGPDPAPHSAATAVSWQPTDVAPAAWQPTDITPAAWQPKRETSVASAKATSADGKPKNIPAAIWQPKDVPPVAGKPGDGHASAGKPSDKGVTPSSGPARNAPAPSPASMEAHESVEETGRPAGKKGDDTTPNPEQAVGAKG
jgi:hypothetical protein